MAILIVNNRTARTAIEERKPFQNSGKTLSGSETDDLFPVIGELPTYWSERLTQDIKVVREKGEKVFVVYSYITPIAWYANGEWTVPDVRYSVTTTKQQGIVRAAIRD